MEANVTIGHRAYQAGVKDAHGNVVAEHGTVVNLEVYAVYPRTSTEPDDPNRTLTVTGLAVLAPPGVTVDPRDLFVWQGEDYEVVGDVADWNTGPFDYSPGIEVLLKRAEG